MKFLSVVCCLFGLAAVAYSEDRLCPDGYRFAGDDTVIPKNNETIDPRHQQMERGGYYVEEVDRTDMYSCYKAVEEPMDWISAMNYCWQDEAQLASMETMDEMIRVRRIYQGYFQPKVDPEGSTLPTGVDLLTSGMYFEEIQNWFWTGSNRSISEEDVYSNSDIPSNKPLMNIDRPKLGPFGGDKSTDNCLYYRMTSPSLDPILLEAKCFERSPFLCEARVQTVTYYTWWTTYWVDFLLGFLIVILFVALCVAVCSFGSRDYGNRNSRRPRTTDATVVHTAHVVDLPPTYDSTVRVHKPPMN